MRVFAVATAPKPSTLNPQPSTLSLNIYPPRPSLVSKAHKQQILDKQLLDACLRGDYSGALAALKQGANWCVTLSINQSTKDASVRLYFHGSGYG